MAKIFETDDRRAALVTRFRQIIYDGLLISKENGPNPEFFRRMRDVLESRFVYFPPLVRYAISGSFIAKRAIAAIWSSQEERVNRDSLLLEYHNIWQEVVRESKDFLQHSPTSQQNVPSTSPPARPSNAPRQSENEYGMVERTLKMLIDEENHALLADKQRRSSSSESDADDQDE